ncbi:TPA: hypothetical protein R6W23_003239 [Citrobacter gillenii]|nr:hypothetical protein [Citrobacter gillenii]
MSKLTKPSYEELERRFQSYCKHDGGRTYDGVTNTICTLCGWDTEKCQHRRSSRADNYCMDCGEKLKQETAQ